MSDEARFGWTHGIDGRNEDWVAESVDSDIGRWVMRSIRVSITFRWLLPGADIVAENLKWKVEKVSSSVLLCIIIRSTFSRRSLKSSRLTGHQYQT